GASEARGAHSARARPLQERREAERESARAGRRGLGASEARRARSARALDGPPESNDQASPRLPARAGFHVRRTARLGPRRRLPPPDRLLLLQRPRPLRAGRGREPDAWALALRVPRLPPGGPPRRAAPHHAALRRGAEAGHARAALDLPGARRRGAGREGPGRAGALPRYARRHCHRPRAPLRPPPLRGGARGRGLRRPGALGRRVRRLRRGRLHREREPGGERHARLRRPRLLLGVQVAAVTAILGCLVAIAALHPRRLDLTPERRFTLSPYTREVLGRLTGDVRISLFYSSQAGALRREMSDLLALYQEAQPRITVRAFDLDRSPGVAKRLGVGSYNTAVVEAGERNQAVELVNEEAVTAALLAVAGTPPVATYFV